MPRTLLQDQLFQVARDHLECGHVLVKVYRSTRTILAWVRVAFVAGGKAVRIPKALRDAMQAGNP